MLVLLLLASILTQISSYYCQPSKFKGCEKCVPNFNHYVCEICQEGFFQFRSGCYPCLYPCSKCSIRDVDNPGLWDQIAVFWDQQFNNAKINNTQPNPLPDFINAFNFTSMPVTFKQQWIEAYYVYHSLNRQITAIGSSTFNNMLFEIVRLVELTRNYAPKDRWQSFTLFANSKLSKNWTTLQFTDKLDISTSRQIKCLSCNQSFYLDTTTYKCLPCMQGCSQCQNALTCQHCYDKQIGFALKTTNDGTVCTPCTVLGCTSCQEDGICLQCQIGRVLVQNKCQPCQGACSQCAVQNNSCSKCMSGYSLYPNQQGKCYRCTNENCLQCKQDNSSFCLVCSNYNSFSSDGLCRECPSNCAICSASKCLSCYAGYSLHNSTCVACPLGCNSCSSSSLCDSCLTKFYLNLNTDLCEPCPSSADSCQTGVPLAKCRKGCQVCLQQNPQICQRCIWQYFLDVSICRKCPSGCKICQSEMKCTLCMASYYLNNNSCQKCSQNCAQCHNQTVCISCKNGYFVQNDNCQTKCPNNCQSCTQEGCYECNYGYTLTRSGVCVKCISTQMGSCAHNSVTTPRLGSGDLSQQQFPISNSKPTGCMIYINGNCVRAIEGYQISLQKSCIYPCSTCNGSICLSCQTGYTLTNNNCLIDFTCNPNCQICPAGSFRNSSSCQLCPLSSQCSSCLNGTCFQCNQGYYLDILNGSCIQCPSKCKICIDENFCLICQDGYLKQAIISKGIMHANTQSCIFCSSNCLTCIQNPSRCTSCHPGLTLQSRRCIFKYSILFNFSFQAEKLAVEQFQTFIQSLSQLAGVSQQMIFLDAISESASLITIVGRIFIETLTLGQQHFSTLCSKDYNQIFLPKLPQTVLSASFVLRNELQYNLKAWSYAFEKKVSLNLNTIGIGIGFFVLVLIISVPFIIKNACKFPSYLPLTQNLQQ